MSVCLTSVAYIRSAGGVCGQPAGWRVLADRARPAWLESAAEGFHCRPGRVIPWRLSTYGLFRLSWWLKCVLWSALTVHRTAANSPVLAGYLHIIQLIVTVSGSIQSRWRHSQPDRAGEESSAAVTDGQLPAEVWSRSVQIRQRHVPCMCLASSLPSLPRTAQKCLGTRTSEVCAFASEHLANFWWWCCRTLPPDCYFCSFMCWT